MIAGGGPVKVETAGSSRLRDPNMLALARKQSSNSRL